jgi:hypothetical protein
VARRRGDHSDTEHRDRGDSAVTTMEDIEREREADQAEDSRGASRDASAMSDDQRHRYGLQRQERNEHAVVDGA